MSGRSGSHAVPRGRSAPGLRAGRPPLATGYPASCASVLHADAGSPGQAGLVIVGESKVEDAIQHTVTRAEKQTAKELDVDPKNVDKALQATVKEM